MGTISGCLDLGEDTRALGDSAVFSTGKNTFVLQVAFTSISLVLELWNGASKQRTIWLRILDRLAKDVAHKASSAMPAEK